MTLDKTVEKLVKATNNLNNSPIVEYFKNVKYFDLNNFSLIFNRDTEKFLLRYNSEFVFNNDNNKIKIHRFSEMDDQQMLLHGTVEDFQNWMQTTVVPSYQQNLSEFVDKTMNKFNELKLMKLAEFFKDNDLMKYYIPLGHQLASLQISWCDVDFTDVIYALVLYIFMFTKTGKQPENNFAIGIDNAMLILKFTVESQANFTDTEKDELCKIFRWLNIQIRKFVDSPQLVHDFQSLQELVQNKKNYNDEADNESDEKVKEFFAMLMKI